MEDFSILIGGKAGFGIDRSATLIAGLLGQAGYRVYIYREYPSLIRGGHTFSIIRACGEKVAVHQDKIDLILALDQQTIDLHKHRLQKDCLFIFDSDQIKPDLHICGLGVGMGSIIKQENAPEITRNTCMIGSFARSIGMEFAILEKVLRKEFAKDIDLNLKVAQRGFDAAKQLLKIKPLKQEVLPLLSGNQGIALGLIKGGLDAYLAYPMTPSSPILHYLAGIADNFALNVIHPESEISVILMALGFAYAGKRAAVGTSGGGFCLMTEGLSLSAMAELPVVIVLGQRPGPSTGLPTYSSQTELHFAINAGQGEFARFIVAPGDAEEAYYWSAVAMNMSWKYQLPAIILSDKDMGEGVFSFDISAIGKIEKEEPSLWDGELPYKRYALTDSGVSPLAYPPEKDSVIKVNSYEHDEFGITTEEAQKTIIMQDKRLRKEKFLNSELENIKSVNVYAGKDSQTALICWGSNKGVCVELGGKLGLKVVQPVVLNPFPVKQLKEALVGVKRAICVEGNATGQLAHLMQAQGFSINDTIFKYDGRPFSLDELEELLRQRLGGRQGVEK